MNGADDTGRIPFLKTMMDRQSDHRSSRRFCYREISLDVSHVCETGLLRKGAWIVDGRIDPTLRELFSQPISCLEADYVLVPAVIGPFGAPERSLSFDQVQATQRLVVFVGIARSNCLLFHEQFESYR